MTTKLTIMAEMQKIADEQAKTLAALQDKRAARLARKHGNIPL